MAEGECAAETINTDSSAGVRCADGSLVSVLLVAVRVVLRALLDYTIAAVGIVLRSDSVVA